MEAGSDPFDKLVCSKISTMGGFHCCPSCETIYGARGLQEKSPMIGAKDQ